MQWLKKIFDSKNKIKNFKLKSEVTSMSTISLTEFKKALDLTKIGKNEEALSHLDKVNNNDFAKFHKEMLPDFYSLYAECLKSLNYHFEAIEYYDKAIELSQKTQIFIILVPFQKALHAISKDK